MTKVAFELPDVQHAFLKGHRIMVQVQSSWFPLFDRNPQTFGNIRTARRNGFPKGDPPSLSFAPPSVGPRVPGSLQMIPVLSMVRGS
ncbi:MAG: hypothetical protein MZU84_01930 [Sphingobacterium sp.]|nr:hypothetical protein [Sphingobacterium sp.]